jgi:hypothetical protein
MTKGKKTDNVPRSDKKKLKWSNILSSYVMTGDLFMIFSSAAYINVTAMYFLP